MSLNEVATVVAVWILVGLLLWWGGLPAGVRRVLALLTSAAGLVFLVVAVGTEGVRESPTLGVFLLGTPHVTGQASASASLPYYVLTGACLLLGTAGLALSDDAARRLFRERWTALPIALGITVTALRFTLEKVAAPAALTWAVGIVWLAPVVGAYYVIHLRAEGRGFWHVLKPLVVYAFAVRGFVAALMAVATKLDLGSHYDVSPITPLRFAGRIVALAPGSWHQVLYVGVMPQLVFWTTFTVLTGLLGAAVASLAAGVRSPRVPAPVATQTEP